MEKNPPSHNAVVTKNNILIPKLAKMGLSELRLLTFCLAHFDSRPEYRKETGYVPGVGIPQEFIEITARVQNLVDIFPGMDRKSAYAVVRQAVKGINSKPFEDTFVLPNGKTRSGMLYWFSSFWYDNEEGRFTFKLSPDIVHLVLSQDGDFTRFRLRHVYQFKSALTWKLYELLKQWAVAGRWAVDLDELRISLGIAGKYPRWESLKRKVLDAPIKEINELSDIIVKYEKQKYVLSVSGVVFFINTKEAEAKATDPAIVANIGDTTRDVRLLVGAGINQTNAENLSKLAAEANKDLSVFLDRVVARYEAKDGDKPPKQAYIYKALYNEFAPNLFDGQGEAPAKKVDLRPKTTAKETDSELKKYAQQVFACPHFGPRDYKDIDCPDFLPDTQKCLACDEMIKQYNAK